MNTVYGLIGHQSIIENDSKLLWIGTLETDLITPNSMLLSEVISLSSCLAIRRPCVYPFISLVCGDSFLNLERMEHRHDIHRPPGYIVGGHFALKWYRDWECGTTLLLQLEWALVENYKTPWRPMFLCSTATPSRGHCIKRTSVQDMNHSLVWSWIT